jgi:hypothetical protein
LFFHQKEIVEKELETSETLLTENLIKAIKGEDLFQDTKGDHWKVEFDIARMKQELVDVRTTTCCGKAIRKHGKGRGDIFLAKANVTSIFPYRN